MGGKVRHTNELIGIPKVIRDLLPALAGLAFRDEDVTIKISPSRKSLEFFTSEAAKAEAQGRRAIRRVPEANVEAHADNRARRSKDSRRKANGQAPLRSTAAWRARDAASHRRKGRRRFDGASTERSPPARVYYFADQASLRVTARLNTGRSDV
jgi:hypothetical protein